MNPDDKGDVTSSPPPQNTTRKPSRRKRWIVVTIILILLILLAGVGGGAYFAYQQYPALNATGLRFCNDLLNQNYSDAYGLLSSRLRQKYTKSAFVSMSQTLDTTEGKTTLCGQATNGSFQVGIFPLSVTVATVLTRATLGKRQGNVRLVYEQGRWLVDDINASLLGVNLDALMTALSLCTDLSIQAKTDAAVTQKYEAIWALYAKAAQAQTTEATFLELGQLHDDLDQKVEYCSIASIGKNSTDSVTRVTYTSKRNYSLESHASATLRLIDGIWKFSDLDSSVFGQNMAPALSAARFFKALVKGDCSAAYAEVSSATQKRLTLAQFSSRICDAPVDWSIYNIDPTSYNAVSTTSYAIGLMDISYDELAQLIATHPNLNLDTIYSGYVLVTYSSGSWSVGSLHVQ